MDSETGTIAVAMKLKSAIARMAKRKVREKKTHHKIRALPKDKKARVEFFILLSAKRIQKGLDASSMTAGTLPRMPTWKLEK